MGRLGHYARRREIARIKLHSRDTGTDCSGGNLARGLLGSDLISCTYIREVNRDPSSVVVGEKIQS